MEATEAAYVGGYTFLAVIAVLAAWLVAAGLDKSFDLEGGR